jgi:hypothetical protein
LHTQRYRDDCESIFGRFLHHAPTEHDDDDTAAKEEMQEMWYQTSALYAKEFGKPYHSIGLDIAAFW